MTAHDRIIEEYMTEQEMAKILGISHATMKKRRYIESPDCPPHTSIGDRTLYSVESFRRWLKNRETRRTA